MRTLLDRDHSGDELGAGVGEDRLAITVHPVPDHEPGRVTAAAREVREAAEPDIRHRRALGLRGRRVQRARPSSAVRVSEDGPRRPIAYSNRPASGRARRRSRTSIPPMRRRSTGRARARITSGIVRSRPIEVSPAPARRSGPSRRSASTTSSCEAPRRFRRHPLLEDQGAQVADRVERRARGPASPSLHRRDAHRPTARAPRADGAAGGTRCRGRGRRRSTAVASSTKALMLPSGSNRKWVEVVIVDRSRPIALQCSPSTARFALEASRRHRSARSSAAHTSQPARSVRRSPHRRCRSADAGAARASAHSERRCSW